MKVYITGMGTRHPDVRVPALDGTPGKTEPHTTVDSTRVLKVKELEEWCRNNGDVTASDLAKLLARGEFG